MEELACLSLLALVGTFLQLFTPAEATGPVTSTIMSHSTVMRLNLSFVQQEELSNCARTLALQCPTKDPPHCGVHSLHRTCAGAIPLALKQLIKSSLMRLRILCMTSVQLLTIARYMEHRGYPHRAYKLALVAMKNVHQAYHQDTHPAINDIHWACGLSHSLGKSELITMIPLLVKNVQCATVLSDVLRRCAVSAPVVASACPPMDATDASPCSSNNNDSTLSNSSTSDDWRRVGRDLRVIVDYFASTRNHQTNQVNSQPWSSLAMTFGSPLTSAGPLMLALAVYLWWKLVRRLTA